VWWSGVRVEGPTAASFMPQSGSTTFHSSVAQLPPLCGLALAPLPSALYRRGVSYRGGNHVGSRRADKGSFLPRRQMIPDEVSKPQQREDGLELCSSMLSSVMSLRASRHAYLPR
jgi:hypothetical protein